MPPVSFLYTLRDDDDPKGFEQLRITCDALTAYTVGKWHGLNREVQDFMAERLGQYPTAMEPEDWDQYPAAEKGLYEIARKWARCIAATTKVERRTEIDGAWEEIELWGSWRTLEGALDPHTGISLQGIYVWDDAATEANPGFWTGYMGPAEKKVGFAVRT